MHDLTLTNRPRNTQDSFKAETGLSHFFTMTVTLLSSHHPKLGPQIIKYRDYKKFSKA